jgi:hypothetical protein
VYSVSGTYPPLSAARAGRRRRAFLMIPRIIPGDGFGVAVSCL